MNKTKFWLILFAVIFTFADIGWDIYNIVCFFMEEPQNRPTVFYLIYDFIEIFALLAVAVLLTISIWDKGKHFRARYRYYMISLMISILTSLFSITSILLIISMFVSEWQWIGPEKEKQTNGNVVNISDTKEEKIAKLRRKRDNGEITEQQFQEEIMKLL